MNSKPFAIGSKQWAGTSKLVEETGELQQVLGKLIQLQGSTMHWDGDLKTRVIAELGDVLAAVEFFSRFNLSKSERTEVSRRAETKLKLFVEWHASGDTSP